jgi:hypothetical protein
MIGKPASLPDRLCKQIAQEGNFLKMLLELKVKPDLVFPMELEFVDQFYLELDLESDLEKGLKLVLVVFL